MKLKSYVSSSNASFDVVHYTSHWCCSVDTTKETIVSKTTLIYTTEAVQIASNHTCGFLGLQTCTNHHTVYKYIYIYIYFNSSLYDKKGKNIV